VPATQEAPSRNAPEAPARTRPVTVAGGPRADRPLRVVERALARPPDRRTAGWHEQVILVPQGCRPGRPDPLKRDRDRARLPLTAGHRVVVLGCTVGAGQTVTTLLTGELLASLRSDRVAVLDLNSGTGSLTERARTVPSLTGSQPPAPSRLEVFSREAAAAASPGADQEDAASVFEVLSARYPLALADPGPAAVPGVLAVASQLVLVAPASADAAAALAATREWLDAHGHAGLAEAAITVLNGVSGHTMRHVEQAEALARGRSRAIVRIPWDDRLKAQDSERSRPPVPGPAQPVPGVLSPAALHAYTALAGLLVAAVATAPPPASTVPATTGPGNTGPGKQQGRP
jgi:MinD-like ATPase involved in chromosome partitioning or flagellar assembly